MNKRKNVIILLSCIVFVLLVGVALFFGLRACFDSSISFTVKDTLPDGQGRVVKIILLGGQSNASGCSRDEYLKQKVSSEKYAEYKNGYDNVYINYYATGTNESQGFVKCGACQGEAGGFFGPELGMAEELHRLYPGELFFIIKWAFGGSNLFEQWLSPSSRGKTGRMYKEFVKYVETSIDYLVSKNYVVEIEGMCWMQGESDSFSTETAEDYAEHLDNLINDIRCEFSSYAADGGIAFIDAYIAENPAYWVYYELVNKAKDEVAKKSPLNSLVDTVFYGLSCAEEPAEAPDLAHYDALSQLKLGQLFAEHLAKFIE